MSQKDACFLGTLFLLALFIWTRDLSWVSAAEDTLPALAALPLFIWLGSPWRLKDSDRPLPGQWIAAAVLLFLTGIILDLNIFLALGWCFLLWAWIATRIDLKEQPHIHKLMIFPLLAFPWITLDLTRIGWWIRLSGASATAFVYHLFGFDVQQVGTSLMINGVPFSVELACSGLNTLQSLLIAGIFMSYSMLKESALFWWNIPLLVALAWFANSLRIIFVAGAALAVNPEFAVGTFHTWGGLVILLAMFALCYGIFSLQQGTKGLK